MKPINGLYHGSYDLKFTAPAKSPSGRAFIIPGQGSAYPGMFRDLLSYSTEFAEGFAFADANSGLYDLLPVSMYITSPQSLPQEKMHVYRNCALYVSEVALGKNLLRRGVKADAITGHSFGECAGLVLSGIFSFEDMFHVVVNRNLLCPPANVLGLMVAVNGSKEKLLEFLALPGVYLANLNSPKQLVVSIAADAKDTALDWLRKFRTPHIILTGLPQPYHSPLMEPYRIKLFDRISQLRYQVNTPEIPFFSGIHHGWITTDTYRSINFTDLLARQLTEPVQFIEQVEAMAAAGCSRYYEVGPGKMLEPPLRTILGERQKVYRSAEFLVAKDLETHRPVKPQNEGLKKSRWFGKIKEVLHAVTGYRTDDIDISHSFQNDLGIDSIKKAEILVTIIRDEMLNAGPDFSVTRFSTIYEAVEYLENYSVDEDPLRPSHEPRIELLTPEWQKSSFIVSDDLKSSGSQIVHLKWGADLFTMKEMREDSLIVIECPRGTSPDSEFLLKLLGSYGKFITEDRNHLPHICLLDKTDSGAYLAGASLFRSLIKETHSFTFTYLQDPDDYVTDEVIRRERVFGGNRDVLFSNGNRFVKAFIPFAGRLPSERAPKKILALGGSRGINYEILRRFPVVDGDELILVGRTKRDDRSIREQLSLLSKVWKRFTYLEADLEDSAGTLKILSKNVSGKIDILVNAAGKEVSQNFDERSAASVKSEIDSKLKPLATVDEITKKFNVSRVINFSSVVSQFGNKGQATYAWSNALLESRSDSAVCLAWGPWEDVGMTTNLGILQKIKEWGISLITPEDGAKLAALVMLTEEKLPKLLVPLDQKDVFLLTVELNRTGLMGKLTDNFESVFQNEIRIADAPFLDDHNILGKRVFPVAWILSQLLAYGKNIHSRMVSVENFEVHNMIFLEGETYQFKTQIFPRAPHDVTVWTYLKNASGNLNPRASLSPMKIPHRTGEKAIALETFYDAETFGSRFRFLKHAFADSELNVRSMAILKELPDFTGNRSFDMWLYLIDLSLQTISLQIKIKTGAVIMPVSIGRIVFTEGSITLGEKVFVYPEIHSGNDREALATVTLTTESNDVICRLENVIVRKHLLEDRVSVEFQVT